MKDQEKIKPSKKKVLLRILIVAACLLVIAAITLAIVFSVGGNTNQLAEGPDNSQTDNPGNQGDGGNSGNQGQIPDGGDSGNEGQNPDQSQDTSSQYDFISPVKDVNVARSYEFGYDKTMDWYCLHEGMDFSAAAGTQVFAAVDGTITEITSKDVDILCGDSITIEHANGLKTVYMFLDVDPDLKVGAKVSRGDVIGTVAAANGVENADGEHLHFEVFKNGESVDPDEYLNVLSK